MKIARHFLLGFALALVSGSGVAMAAEQKDDRNCADHPLFTRMPNSWIHHCSHKIFDAFNFPTAKGRTTTVEGELWKISYYPQADVKERPSELQILRNFENAVQRIGGVSVYKEKAQETFKIQKDGKEIWVQVWAEFTGKYSLAILQKKGMGQDIVADAAVFANDIKATGHVAIYGIHFDTNKSEVKPESRPALEEIAKLLKQNPSLRLKVVGHTDMAGGLEQNMKLSEARAQAVVQALVTQHGIAASRLKGFGVGPLAPVATNDTEEGKARNRRVELVKE